MRLEQPATRGSIGAAASGSNSDITALTGLTAIPLTTAGALTTGTLTRANSSELRSFHHKFQWTNAMEIGRASCRERV